MLDEIGGENPVASVQDLDASLEKPESAVGSQAGRGDMAQIRYRTDVGRPPEQAEAARPDSLPAAEEVHAAAERFNRDRSAEAGDHAALAAALRSFLEAFAGQNAPTRSEFRDLAARVERLSSQFQKGR